MIDELKNLLDTLSAAPNLALYGLALYIAWRLIVYLSTAGAIVFVLKLAIEKMHNWKTMPPHPEPEPPKPPPVDYFAGDTLMVSSAVGPLNDLLWRLRRVRRGKDGKYLHSEDIEYLRGLFEDDVAKQRAGGND